MSRPAENFTEVVEGFCTWAEGDCHGLIEARQLLLSLMISIPHIEEFRYAGTSEEDFPRRGHEGWEQDHKRFADLPFQFYRAVFNPHDLYSSDEPGMGDLADDLADIYMATYGTGSRHIEPERQRKLFHFGSIRISTTGDTMPALR